MSVFGAHVRRGASAFVRAFQLVEHGDPLMPHKITPVLADPPITSTGATLQERAQLRLGASRRPLMSINLEGTTMNHPATPALGPLVAVYGLVGRDERLLVVRDRDATLNHVR